MKRGIRGRQQLGFTLIELMVVVAVVAILTMVAVGSYQNQTLRSKRAAAVGFILQVANKQEQYLLDNRDYATSMAELSISAPSEVSDFYTISVDDNDAGSDIPGYVIRATPKAGTQTANDTDCGWLELNHQGDKDTQYDGSRCWK